ncbi:hypothetical protein I553_10834 [Mycobacterium xenopi 4042]|uniref:Uncharacterized protein n=1 Tax=Mycobacterium xenopi 4042 TaxID=1299334 RepID=X8DA80_MYCXE|nr:hypothetical protein I553_10834 [Mycobacterium xenopi 4042]
MLGLGKHASLVRAVNMGSHTVGESLRSTPEFGAAMALVAALNDPQRPGADLLLGGWSCAVFGAGASARFVVAERHGLSWIPAGVYLPYGVTVAHLDERVSAEERVRWRGMEPSALVLSQYAQAVGERPRIVVAREYRTGLDAWFDRRTVVVADKGERVIIPNPVTDSQTGHHRLALASPGDWALVQSLGDSEIPAGCAAPRRRWWRATMSSSLTSPMRGFGLLRSTRLVGRIRLGCRSCGRRLGARCSRSCLGWWAARSSVVSSTTSGCSTLTWRCSCADGKRCCSRSTRRPGRCWLM